MALIRSGSSSVTVGGAAGQFRTVLTKLTMDKGYLQATINNPAKLLADYPDLTVEELGALRHAAVLSGADFSRIDPLHAQMVGTRPGAGVALGGDGCCCCCCCGVTGKITMG